MLALEFQPDEVGVKLLLENPKIDINVRDNVCIIFFSKQSQTSEKLKFFLQSGNKAYSCGPPLPRISDTSQLLVIRNFLI